MSKQLSNISTIATEETNTTGELTPILVVNPKDGTKIVLQGNVPRGTAPGIPIFAKLKNAAGDDLPQDTKVVLRYKRPRMDDYRTVSHPKDHIRPYQSLSIQDQQNEEYIDSVKHELKGQALVADDVDEIQVAIESSEQIDWSNSQLTFADNAVREV